MTHALSISNLSKTYENGNQALQSIELNIKQGDFFALLGANGAGKSTALGIISSLVNKTSGSIKIMGHDLDNEREVAKSCIGLVPQEFNFNIYEPVEEIIISEGGYFGIDRKAATERCEALLKQLDLWNKRKEQAKNLSGGMKRRLMIARALVHNPKILILDEPTAGVDIEIRRSMWEFLTELNRNGTPIILTTHYLEEAEQLCRNIAIIDAGKIIKNTSMKQLLSLLKKETYILDLMNSLSEKPNINEFEVSLRDASTLEVVIDKNRSLNFLFDTLSKSNIKVKSMRNKANRLEALFLKLVDKKQQEK